MDKTTRALIDLIQFVNNSGIQVPVGTIRSFFRGEDSEELRIMLDAMIRKLNDIITEKDPVIAKKLPRHTVPYKIDLHDGENNE